MRSECAVSTRKRVSLLVALILVVLVHPWKAAGQDSNLALIERLGVECLQDAPGSIRAFALAAPDTMPYLRAAVISAWRERDLDVSLRSEAREDLATLRYGVDDLSIAYRRVGRGELRRDISLSLQYTLATPDGRIIHDAVCRETAVDTIRTRDRALVEDAAYAETLGPEPPGGLARRIIEPAVLIGAVSIGVFLFFSLRSDRSAE